VPDPLAVEEKLNALFAAVPVVTPRARHVVLIAPVGAGDAQRPLADRGAVAVHRGIAAPQHQHLPAAHADESVRSTLEAQLELDVGNEVRQGLVDPGQFLAGEPAPDGGVGAHTEKHGVVLAQQLPEGEVAPYLAPEAESDTQAYHRGGARLQDILLELEGGNPESEQSADTVVTLEHDRLHAVAHQHVRARESGGTRADHRHALAAPLHV